MLDNLIRRNYGNPLKGFLDYEDFATSCMVDAITNELQGLYCPNIRLHFISKELMYRSCPGIGAVSLLKEYTIDLVHESRKENEPLLAFVATYKDGGNITVVCVEKDAKDALVILRNSDTAKTTICREEFSGLDKALEPLVQELTSSTSGKQNPINSGQAIQSSEPKSTSPQIKSSPSRNYVKAIRNFFNK